MRSLFAGMVFLLMALPFAWFYIAMYWGFTVSRDIARFQEGEEVVLAPIPPVQWLNDRAELYRFFAPDEITPGRTVLTRIELPFTDMLEDGEVMPPRAFKDLYATLRAPALLAPLCDEILGTLAVACDVGSFEGEVKHTGQDTHRLTRVERPEGGEAIIRGSIRYIPAYPMGDPSIVPNGELVSVGIDLLEGGSVDTTPEGRREIFAEAEALCNGLRVRFGNCVLTSVVLKPGSRPYRNDPDPYLRTQALAGFKVVVDRTKYRRPSVQAELVRIAETRVAAIETLRGLLP